jgi:capsular polysaccharide biosynthesis protein
LTPEIRKNSFLHYTKDMVLKNYSLPKVKFLAPKINIYDNKLISGKLGKIQNQKNIQEDSRSKVATIVVITCDYYDIYYHWLFDFLPKFKVLQKSIKEYDAIYIPKPESKFQIDALRKLNLSKPLIFAEENTRVFAKKVFVIGKLSIDTTIPPWVFGFVRSLFKTKIIKGYEKIFISRKYARNRRILNEPDLNSFFKKNNIRIVYLEKLNINKQANIFFSAKLIIAPHGSGLTNLVFSTPNTKIIELKGPRCAETSFARLANWSRLYYLSMDCPDLAYKSNFNRVQSFFDETKNCWDFLVHVTNIKDKILNLSKCISKLD